MTKHTPGPWAVDPYTSIDKNIYIDGGLASVDCDETPLAVAEANAHLIAAAPDMLAALQSLVGEWPEGEGMKVGDRIKQARAAIAKATATAVANGERK